MTSVKSRIFQFYNRFRQDDGFYRVAVCKGGITDTFDTSVSWYDTAVATQNDFFDAFSIRQFPSTYPLQNRPASKSATHVFASKSDTHYMMTSQFRSGRGKTRKAEISRDFSAFLDSEFFLSFIDPICPFRCCVLTRTHEKGFFASSRKQSTLWLDSDLRKRSRTV